MCVCNAKKNKCCLSEGCTCVQWLLSVSLAAILTFLKSQMPRKKRKGKCTSLAWVAFCWITSWFIVKLNTFRWMWKRGLLAAHPAWYFLTLLWSIYIYKGLCQSVRHTFVTTHRHFFFVCVLSNNVSLSVCRHTMLVCLCVITLC